MAKQAVEAPAEEYVAFRALNFSGVQYQRGAVIPPKAMAAALNAEQMLHSGAVIRRPAGTVPRTTPPPIVPIKPKPDSLVGLDPFTTVARLAGKIAKQRRIGFDDAVDMVGHENVGLYDAAQRIYAQQPKGEQGGELPVGQSYVGRRVTQGFRQALRETFEKGR
jgi:hypothetical protein